VLKAQSDADWDDQSTTQSVFRYLGGVPVNIGAAAINLTSHNSFPETDDNWDIQSVHVTVADSSGDEACVLKEGGNLTGRKCRPKPTPD
jgi:hypothetical protein